MKEKGVGIRAISRALNVSRNSVRNILKQAGNNPPEKESKYVQHLEIIRALFRECHGNGVRIQEELAARHGVNIPYQSLTWLLRKYEIGNKKRKRAGRYVFEPGEEMQHDTSPHKLVLGEKKLTVQCASLVLSYSRRIYMQYYPCFTRFECRVFLAKAFGFMDGTAGKCIIDNTHVIVASGVGPDALITPEMEHFGRIYQTCFEPHWLNNPNRKARVERPFHYIENNFLPGRTFRDWDDLNDQAEAWCNNVSNAKRKRSLGMSPDAAYVIEKPALNLLPPVSPPVYKSFYRVVDIEGYVHLDTNRYSVPHKVLGKKLEVQKHWDKVVIYDRQVRIADHKRVIGKKDARITHPGHHPPLNRNKTFQGPSREEELLTGNNETLDRYVRKLKEKSRGRGVMNLRRLLTMKRTYPLEPFMAGINKALQYGLYDLARVEKIILANTAGDFFNLS